MTTIEHKKSPKLRATLGSISQSKHEKFMQDKNKENSKKIDQFILMSCLDKNKRLRDVMKYKVWNHSYLFIINY